MTQEELDFTIVYAARYRGMSEQADRNQHKHRLYQLYVLCSDRLKLYIENQTIVCDHKSHILLVKPGEMHVLNLIENDPENSWLSPGINCALDCKFAVNSPALAEKLDALKSPINVGDTSAFIRLSTLMLDSLADDTDAGRNCAYSAFASILGLMIRCGNTEKRHTAGYDVTCDEPYFFSNNYKQTADTEGIAAVKRYIDLHYRERITLEDLIQISCINRTCLTKKFKQAYGHSPIDYVLYRRIEEAKLLLYETALEINKLAERVGFSGASYFSRIFRRYTGMSPNEYRVRESAMGLRKHTRKKQTETNNNKHD